MGCLLICALLFDIIRCIWVLSTLELSPFWRTFNIILLIIEVIVLLVLIVVGARKSSDDNEIDGDLSEGQGS